LGMKTYDYTTPPTDAKGNPTKGNTPYVPNSVEYQYASSDMRGVLRPTITDGTIIVRNDPNADLAGLNRDITKAREITKDKQINVDVYYSPGAIDEIASGFKGIRQGGAQAIYDVVVVGIFIDALVSSLSGSGNPDPITETAICNGVIRGMDRMEELSKEWRIIMSGERTLTAEEQGRFAATLEAVAAEQGLSLRQFVLYASKLLPGGQYNPGDPSVGLDGKTLGVNMIDSDGKTMIGGLDFLRRVVHEVGHPL
jgi:hypothetical protein